MMSLRFIWYLEQMPKEISEIPRSSTRPQLVAGIVDAGSCDSFRKFLMRIALERLGERSVRDRIAYLLDPVRRLPAAMASSKPQIQFDDRTLFG
jgi:hypothetical protein